MRFVIGENGESKKSGVVEGRPPETAAKHGCSRGSWREQQWRWRRHQQREARRGATAYRGETRGPWPQNTASSGAVKTMQAVAVWPRLRGSAAEAAAAGKDGERWLATRWRRRRAHDGGAMGNVICTETDLYRDKGLENGGSNLQRRALSPKGERRPKVIDNLMKVLVNHRTLEKETLENHRDNFGKRSLENHRRINESGGRKGKDLENHQVVGETPERTSGRKGKDLENHQEEREKTWKTIRRKGKRPGKPSGQTDKLLKNHQEEREKTWKTIRRKRKRPGKPSGQTDKLLENHQEEREKTWKPSGQIDETPGKNIRRKGKRPGKPSGQTDNTPRKPSGGKGKDLENHQVKLINSWKTIRRKGKYLENHR
ncbi:choice-of-anchor A family protein [Sesbania bispinosa]|nr:choice-of-anchor A family protein [Sesbania bispinosa]